MTGDGDLSLWVGYQERNHGVSLDRVTAAEYAQHADPEDEWPWPWPNLRPGDWYASCQECGEERWSIRFTKKGKPRGRWWWLCPRGCNLSERSATALLARAGKGLPLPPGVTEAACRVVIAAGEARRAHVRERGSLLDRADIEKRDRAAAMTDEEREAELRLAEFMALISEEPESPPLRDPLPVDWLDDF